MKNTISAILFAVIIVLAIFMLCTFFWQFPQPLVIGGIILLIISIVALLIIDRDKKEK